MTRMCTFVNLFGKVKLSKYLRHENVFFRRVDSSSKLVRRTGDLSKNIINLSSLNTYQGALKQVNCVQQDKLLQAISDDVIQVV